MTKRDDELGRKQDRTARRLERRLVRLDRQLARIRRDLIDAVDETALIEGRLAALRGYRAEGEAGSLVDGDATWKAEGESDDESDDESDEDDDDEPGDESDDDESDDESDEDDEPDEDEPDENSGENAADRDAPIPSGTTMPAPPEPETIPAPVPAADTPWERGVRELADRRSAEAATETRRDERMEQYLVGAPVPPPADAWPVIDPDRTW